MTTWAKENPLDGNDVIRNIVDRLVFNNLAAVLPITNLSPKSPGEYLVFLYVMCFITDVTAGQMSFDLQFTDETGSNDTSLGTLSLNSPNFLSTIFLIRSINGIVSFSSSLFGSIGTAKYTFRMTCQKL
jgi:hypothetical protein